MCGESGGCLEDRTSGDESTLESKIEGMLILNKCSNVFEVDSNLEDFR